MTVRHSLRRKSPAVHSVEPQASLAEAARRLRQHSVGALAVLDGAALVGIVSERDLWAAGPVA